MKMLAICAWFASFSCAVWILYWLLKHAVPGPLANRRGLVSDAYFLFDGNRLLKASRAGRQLLAPTKHGAKDEAKGWAEFYACFELRFAKLPQRPSDLDTHQDVILKSADGAKLQMQAVGRCLRMTLIEAEAEKDYFATQ